MVLITRVMQRAKDKSETSVLPHNLPRAETSIRSCWWAIMSEVDDSGTPANSGTTTAPPKVPKSSTIEREQTETPPPGVDSQPTSSSDPVEPLEYNDTTIDPAQLQGDGHTSSNESTNADAGASTEANDTRSSWAQDEHGTKRVKVRDSYRRAILHV